MELFEDLRWRGAVHQWTGGDELPARLERGPLTLYCGFDPTSDSLHIGHLVQLVTLSRFQRAGHRPIAVAGGATGMVGDPSGRSEERNLLSADDLAANVAAIRAQLGRFLDFQGDGGALLVDNAEWLSRFGFIEFLRDVGKHVPVNVMVAKESVRARLESEAGLSFTEFSYMLMQAYDFVHLSRTYGCELQIGGSDQWGNITAGIDLARRLDGAHLHGLTTPLITRSDGQKFGKTAAGAVWLAPERTSPYAFYQYFVRVPDSDVGACLRLFTLLDRDEIEDLERRSAANPAVREAQRRLAREMTLLVHGREGLQAAERATEAFFGGELEGLGARDLAEIFADVPSAELPRARLGALTVADLLAETGLVRSKAEARRLVEGGGAYLNNLRAEDPDAIVASESLVEGSVLVVRAGKRNYALVSFRP